MKRTWLWILFLLAAAAQIFLLVWVRGEYRTVQAEGLEYTVPVNVNFTTDFYQRNYLSLYVPIDKAQWVSPTAPAVGEEVYVAISNGKNNEIQVLRAQIDQPEGDYILVRAKGLDGDVLHFDFPVSRLYLDGAQLRRVSVTELSERVRVENPDTHQIETRMKNSLVAILRIKDGRVVIDNLLVNGSPVTLSYTTVGTKADVKFATSGREEDTTVPLVAE